MKQLPPPVTMVLDLDLLLQVQPGELEFAIMVGGGTGMRAGHNKIQLSRHGDTTQIVSRTSMSTVAVAQETTVTETYQRGVGLIQLVYQVQGHQHLSPGRHTWILDRGDSSWRVAGPDGTRQFGDLTAVTGQGALMFLVHRLRWPTQARVLRFEAAGGPRLDIDTLEPEPAQDDGMRSNAVHGAAPLPTIWRHDQSRVTSVEVYNPATRDLTMQMVAPTLVGMRETGADEREMLDVIRRFYLIIKGGADPEGMEDLWWWEVAAELEETPTFAFRERVMAKSAASEATACVAQIDELMEAAEAIRDGDWGTVVLDMGIAAWEYPLGRSPEGWKMVSFPVKRHSDEEPTIGLAPTPPLDD